MTAPPFSLSEHRPESGSASRRDFLIGGALLTAAGLGFAGSTLNRPKQLPQGALEGAIPERIGPWASRGNGGLIVPEESDLSRNTYDQVLSRFYVAENGPPVMLLIAYGGNQSGNMQLHRPEACYPAAGFTLANLGIAPIEALPGRSIPTKRIEAVAPGRVEQILYWTRIGDQFPASASAQRWAVVRDNLRGEVPDGILVRVSTIGQTADEALPLLRDFIRALFAASSATGRALLAGRG